MRTVLMIDDDRLQCRLIEKFFERFRGERFQLRAVLTYEEGMAELMKGEYAACLLDYQLGARDGLALMEEAMAAGATTPIIFLTSETSPEVDTQALDKGAFDYLVKSELTPGSLERSLRYALKLDATLAELRQLATRDSLTGLLNRREFSRLLSDEVTRVHRFGHPLSMVILDLDYFKTVNDTQGHQAGDAILIEVAKCLSAGLRRTDRVARYGGEEFAVLLVETDIEPAFVQAKRLIELIRQTSISLSDGTKLTVTASAGVAALQPLGDAQALIGAADRALYRAKSEGRARACVEIS